MPRLHGLITGLATVTLLSIAVGTTSARNLSASNQNLRVTWASLEFFNNINAVTMRCPVTLEGSFHARTIAKVLGALIGYITKAIVKNEACTNGHWTVLTGTLPWHLTYQGFTGTLPSILTLKLLLIRLSYQIEDGINICLAVTTTEQPFEGIAALSTGGRVESLRADETRRIALRNGERGIGCGLGNGAFRGSATVALLGTANSISITLI